jgi:hypothetical protein
MQPFKQLDHQVPLILGCYKIFSGPITISIVFLIVGSEFGPGKTKAQGES